MAICAVSKFNEMYNHSLSGMLLFYYWPVAFDLLVITGIQHFPSFNPLKIKEIGVDPIVYQKVNQKSLSDYLFTFSIIQHISYLILLLISNTICQL